MTLANDLLVNLAANLATDLIERAGAHLQDAAFGDAKTRALRHAWEEAFHAMLEDVAADLNEDDVALLDGLFRDFVHADGVAEALLDLALADREPDLLFLRERFNALGHDAATLQVDFAATLIALTQALTAALLDEAMEPESPLYNRVSLVRTAAMHRLLRDQHTTLESVSATITRLEKQLPTAKYNLVFLGPATGMAIGDDAVAQQAPELRPLLERTLDLLTEIATPRLPPPYTDADKDAYLRAVVATCDTIDLPYAPAGEATLPLERIYVALKADRSSPAERKASFDLFRRLATEHEVAGRVDDRALYRAMLLDPYAARYLVYDERLRDRLLEAQEETEKTYHLAEIVRRHRWLVLLGGPGSGKTTLARWLALQLAQAVQSGAAQVTVPGDHVRPDPETEAETEEILGPARLPVLVRVADYAAERWPKPGEDTELPLRNYLGRHLKGRLEPGRRSEALNALVRDYLAAGRVTFILDGLDEVADYGQRQKIAAEIEQLIRSWMRDEHGRSPLQSGYATWHSDAASGGNQLIVTSRIVGYHLRPLHENLPHFVIQPMDDVAVRRFCQNWTRYYQIAEQADNLATAVLEHPNPNVQDQMARNPLLLTILAQVFKGDPEAGLPARRTELYRRATQAVFRQREAAWGRLTEALGGDDQVKILTRVTAYVAFHLHANPDYPAALVDAWQVRSWMRAAVREEEALRSGRRESDVVDALLAAASRLSGFFVARGENAYGFLHRQFQEYFAAWHLVGQMVFKGRRTTTPLLGYLNDPNWREVLLLAVGILEAAAEGKLRDVGLTAPPRAVQEALTAVLDNDDPTGGLLPHNLLFAADALAELARPPAEIVYRVAAGLIQAYRRDNESRFTVLKERVERAFAALPRSIDHSDLVGKALCNALTKTPPGDAGRFTRLAAAELIIKYEWHTPEVARALSKAWQSYLEPAGTLLLALQSAYDHDPHLFSARNSRFRRAVEREEELWDAVKTNPHWKIVVRALYLAPWADLEKEAMVRDSPLTEDLLSLLGAVPAERARLVKLLKGTFTAPEYGEAVRRDAGVALAYLGERSLVSWLVATNGEERPLQRALLAAMYLARDLARDLDLARARARARVRDLARARDLDRARDIIPALETARKRLDESTDGDESTRESIRDAIISALEQARHIEAVLKAEEGISAVWRALGKAWQKESSTMITWARDARPALDLRRLKELDARREEVDWPEILPRLNADSLARLDDGSEATEQAAGILTRWLNAGDVGAPLARHGALLRAEMGTFSPQAVPWLCRCLADPVDLTRYRARRALNQEHLASSLGKETIEHLARCYRCAGDDASREDCIAAQEGVDCWRTKDGAADHIYAVDTYLDWSIKEINHDRADWLRGWAKAEDTAILGRIHRLDDEAWPTFLDWLTSSDPKVQENLLYSTSWLLRLGHVPEEQREALMDVLLDLTTHEMKEVRDGAVTALGHLQEPSLEIGDRLMALSTDDVSRFTLHEALARLAARADDDLRYRVAETLIAAKAHAALVRLHVGRQEKDLTLAVLRETAGLDDLDGPHLLRALLQAGTDDDFWDSYHERIANLVRALAESNGDLLQDLLLSLQDALADDDWPPKRIRLAAVAACADAMSDAFNNAMGRDELESLLVEGTGDAGSHNSRRSAVTALSHLWEATPVVIEVLLTASQDVSYVQQDAVEAAARFRHLSDEFSHEESLTPLTEALTSESGARAYVAARLLAALGSSPAALEVPGLRERIAEILANVLKHPNAEQEVYLMSSSSNIEHKGPLSQALFAALVKVWGLPD